VIRSDRASLGEAERSTFLCNVCGYGAIRTHAPERCPMCGGDRWKQDRRRNANLFGDPIDQTEGSDRDANLPLQREAEETKVRPRARLSTRRR
jgi:hypothetical protein